MESQIKNINQTNAAFAAKSSIAPSAIYRLALLVVPEAVAIRLLSHNPLICVVACLVVFALWLVVDFGPFRATSAPRAEAPKAAAFPANFAKAQWWSLLFCRIVLLGAMIHSKSII